MRGNLDTKVRTKTRTSRQKPVRNGDPRAGLKLYQMVVTKGGMAQVARKAGITVGYLTHLTKGGRKPGFVTLINLAMALQAPLPTVAGAVEEAIRHKRD